MALVTVLGAVLILSLIAVGVVAQVRSQLRMAVVHGQVAEGQVLINSGFDALVREVKGQWDVSNWTKFTTATTERPDPSSLGAWNPCTPVALDSENHGYLCTQMLMGKRQAITRDTKNGAFVQIPAAVRWRVRASDPPHTVYGWIMVQYSTVKVPDPSDPAKTINTYPLKNAWVYYDHNW